NDNDGLTDLNDPGCSNNQDDDESDATTQCQDGIDNDGDGSTDFPDDFGCFSPTDQDETNKGQYQCNDGKDNDNDGLIDQDDPDCLGRRDNTEAPEEEEKEEEKEIEDEDRGDTKKEGTVNHNLRLNELKVEGPYCSSSIWTKIKIENIGQQEIGTIIRISIPSLNVVEKEEILLLQEYEQYSKGINIQLPRTIEKNEQHNLFVDAFFNDGSHLEIGKETITGSTCYEPDSPKTEQNKETSFLSYLFSFFSK
ncbi:MAG: hypothetical protein ABIB47_03825, partial [Candidatus Woesearchaeota archaeon]